MEAWLAGHGLILCWGNLCMYFITIVWPWKKERKANLEARPYTCWPRVHVLWV